MPIQANPPFVRHQVPPASTDNNIDKWLSDHFVWLYPGAERGEKLFVHLPGGANPIQVPASFQFLAREAARLGYHVIVLTYPNQDRGIELLCGGNPACEENVRLGITAGGEGTFPVVDATRANSTDTRLTKLLERLTLDHPEEGWSQFLNDGEPNWSQIVLSGFSFGGSEAANEKPLSTICDQFGSPSFRNWDHPSSGWSSVRRSSSFVRRVSVLFARVASTTGKVPSPPAVMPRRTFSSQAGFPPQSSSIPLSWLGYVKTMTW